MSTRAILARVSDHDMLFDMVQEISACEINYRGGFVEPELGGSWQHIHRLCLIQRAQLTLRAVGTLGDERTAHTANLREHLGELHATQALRRRGAGMRMSGCVSIEGLDLLLAVAYLSMRGDDLSTAIHQFVKTLRTSIERGPDWPVIVTTPAKV